MEVTCKNFDELLPEILKSIDDCIFLAIDCELSGLNVTDEKDNYFETVEERYDAVRRSGSQFLVVQFGLCPFFFDPETNEFSHQAYNFYTFPRQFTTNAPNIRFLCESSSLDFLANSGFDFNKWIYGGITYMTIANEEKMRENLEKRQTIKNSDDNGTLSVPETLKKFLENTNTRIKRFLNSSMTEITIENISPYQRKLIFHNLKPKYSKKLYFETVNGDEYGGGVKDSSDETDSVSSSSGDKLENDIKNNEIDKNESPPTSESFMKPTRSSNTRVLRVIKLGLVEQNARTEDKKQTDLDKIDKGIGFSKVIRKITESNKVVVGHNCLLDISHTVHQFVSELPEGLAEFKTLVQTVFPNLIDTKYMSSSHPFRELISSTVLFDLVKKLQEEPFQLPVIKKASGENLFGYTLGDKKRHEAGFDAFNTGVSFIAMCQYLGTLQTPKKFHIMAESPLVMPFLNKLYMMRMSDITYLNISGTDLTPSRSHVFYVTCPKDTPPKSIQQIFSPFGNIQTCWKNPTSVFVSLNDKDQSSLVMKNIEYSSEYRIIPFATYQKLHREEKKRPLLNEASPERPGDIFKKLVCGDKSPDEHKKKRPKTEKERNKIEEKTFDEPTSWN